MSEPIMKFEILINREKVSHMTAPNGKVTIIPFTGFCESALFTGKILPGAADVQVTNAAGIRHMCAKYMFEGQDAEGRPCHLFVENNGYFEPGSRPKPFHAYPTFMTDSPSLHQKLGKAVYRAEGHSTPEGVEIRIFDAESLIEPEPVEESFNEEDLLPLLNAFATAKEEDTKKALALSEKACCHEKIQQVVLFSQTEGKVINIKEKINEAVLAALIHTLPQSANILFIIFDNRELTALFSMKDKVLDIPHDTLPIFQEALLKSEKDNVFAMPIMRYKQWNLTR